MSKNFNRLSLTPSGKNELTSVQKHNAQFDGDWWEQMCRRCLTQEDIEREKAKHEKTRP